MRPGFAAGKHRRIRRLNGNGFKFGFSRLDSLGNAGDCTPGADAGNQDIDPAIGIPPYFIGGGYPVHLRIGGILELLRDEGIGVFRGKLLSLADGALHTLRSGRQHELGAENDEKLLALLRHGVRHGENEPVPPGGADEGEGDAGVAAGGLNDDGTLLNEALRFRIEYHGHPYPVLDAAGRVEELQLGHHLGFYSLGYAVQPDQRRVADELRNVAGNAPG